MSYYSVIQYMPDQGRKEAVNIGLIVFREDPYLLHVQMTESDERVQRLFPEVKLTALQEMKRNWYDALTHPAKALRNAVDIPWSLERLAAEMERRGFYGSVHCVPFRACALDEGAEADVIASLYKALVLRCQAGGLLMSKKRLIIDTLDDLLINFLVYDRKEDEELGLGDIEKAIRSQEITVEELVQFFRKQLEEAVANYG